PTLFRSTNSWLKSFHALVIVPIGFRARLFVGAKLPPRTAFWDPWRTLAGLNQAVPARTLSIVIAWEINLRKPNTCRVNQSAQKHREAGSRLNVMRSPVFDGISLDCQERRDIGHCTGWLYFPAGLSSLILSLHLHQFFERHLKSFLQPRSHLGRQG